MLQVVDLLAHQGIGFLLDGGHQLSQVRFEERTDGYNWVVTLLNLVVIEWRAEKINLVPHLDHAFVVERLIEFEILEHSQDGFFLESGAWIGDVANVEHQVGLCHLLEGGLEGLNEVMREVADEPDGVQQDSLLTGDQLDTLRGGRERLEQQVPTLHHLTLHHAVHDGTLTRIGVPYLLW